MTEPLPIYLAFYESINKGVSDCSSVAVAVKDLGGLKSRTAPALSFLTQSNADMRDYGLDKG